MKHRVGMDEVGRGALAGPVVTACVCFPKKYKIRDLELPVLIDDSKKLSEKQRNNASEWIFENALSFSIKKGSVSKINKKGIVAATNFAFRQSFSSVAKNMGQTPDEIFIDAFYVPRLQGVTKAQQTPIIHGDSIVFEIAAASIIAKVFRDSLMDRLGKRPRYRNYLWHKNKGYGTKEHRASIKNFGITTHHRTMFVRNIVEKA